MGKEEQLKAREQELGEVRTWDDDEEEEEEEVVTNHGGSNFAHSKVTEELSRANNDIQEKDKIIQVGKPWSSLSASFWSSS